MAKKRALEWAHAFAMGWPQEWAEQRLCPAARISKGNDQPLECVGP